MGKVFAIVQMGCAILACLGYLVAGDYRRSIYWGSAAVLTGSVTL